MDVTMQVIEAQEARSRMQEAKKRIKAEVRRKYESRIAMEVAEQSQDAEIEFARVLSRVHAAGVSQALLRREVLRTNVWSVWTYWRDLANIDPERATTATAKLKSNRDTQGYRWEESDTEFGWAFVLTKDADKNPIEPEAVMTDIRVKDGGVLEVWPNVMSEDSHKSVWDTHFKGDGNAMRKYATRIANETRKEIGK